MSARAFLVELDAAGVRLSLVGDALRFETRPGVHIAPYLERITARKLALVAALRKRQPVTATTPPASWDGAVPPACGWPHLCQTLGPCPRYPHAPCRHDGETP